MIEKFKEVKKLSEQLDSELENLKFEIENKQKEYQERISDVTKITQITEGLNEEEFKIEVIR